MKSNTGKLSCKIISQLEKLHCADTLTDKVAKAVGLNRDMKDNLAIAVTEAVGNAIVHGNHQDPGKSVSIEFSYNDKQIEVTIRDEGTGFDLRSIENPLLPENLLKENGRGIFILSELMDKVDYQFTKQGTVLRMVMKLKP
jgi:serine/threonine-protein kinase RsbW